MSSRDAETLVALQFGLAMVIGDSLELEPMSRRFLVTLLKATGGRSAQLWLKPAADADPADAGLSEAQGHRIAYPQRSLTAAVPEERRRWMQDVARLPPGQPMALAHANGHVHALPVESEGWLFIEQAHQPLPELVVQAIGVVLRRLALACRACHEHARARRLLAAKEAAEQGMQAALQRKQEILALSDDGFATASRNGVLEFSSSHLAALLHAPGRRLASLADIDDALRAAGCPRPDLHAQALTLPAGEAVQGALTLVRPVHRDLHWTLRATEDGRRCVLFLRDTTHETELDRMKSRFLATAAHELRTPLSSVYGFSELLLTRSDLSAERRQQMMGVVHRQAGLLVQLVNQLLDLAKLEASEASSLQCQPTLLGDAVGLAVEAFGLRDDGRAPVVDLHDRTACLLIDSDHFVRVLVNLLSNAHKYSPGGGEVRLSAGIENHERQAWGTVRVTDQGLGMTPEQCARVFERFYRADPSGHIPGTGLGMSIVQQIIELHGGQVEVDSELGRGTTVTTRWPLAATHSG